ncbi:hypothetical protein KSP40_PGU007915 [Platanthera guangdongensis]|uniref:Maturase K n=1 Tax=Platanthera guangdongensis TaxID=2320717 RepID=A0ABR2M2H3_9ASPA
MQLVQHSKFISLSNDANSHLRTFIEIYDMFKFNGASEYTILLLRLRSFTQELEYDFQF